MKNTRSSQVKLWQEQKIYIVEIILLGGICICTMFQQSMAVSLLFRLTFLGLVAGRGVQLYRKPYLNEMHLLSFLTSIICFLHVSIQPDTFSLSYYNKLIIFSCNLLMMAFIDQMEVNKKIVDYILRFNILIACLYPLFFFLSSSPGYLGTYLTLHFSNPNLLAMFILHSLLYCVIGVYYYKDKLVRVFLISLIAIHGYLISLTEARSCYIALIFFGVLYLFNVLSKNTWHISSKMILFCLLIPLIVAIVYMYIANNGFIYEILSFLDFGTGKDIATRVDQWTQAIQAFKAHPLLGDYYGISEGLGYSQKHNTHLDILASYGIFPFIFYMIVLYRGVTKISLGLDTHFTKIAFFAFLTIIIQGTFEAALVSGGVGLYVLSFGYLILAKYQKTNESIYLE